MLIYFQLVMVAIALLFCLLGAVLGYFLGATQTGALVGLGLGIIPGYILAAILEVRPAARKRQEPARPNARISLSRPSKRKRHK